jgi:hypothetical protein
VTAALTGSGTNAARRRVKGVNALIGGAQ